MADSDLGLRERVNRFRALHAGWSLIAPCIRLPDKRQIAEAGRALQREFEKLSSEPAGFVTESCLETLDTGIDSFERQMRQVARDVSVPQLRATVPAQLRTDPRDVLDLLDLMLSAEREQAEDAAAFIPAIDYLVTVLCSGHAGMGTCNPRDPVTLTARMQELCGRVTEDYDSRLPAIEAEFFASADAVASGEWQADGLLRSLACRKSELGSSYFTPGVLRAIVTYNVAIARRIEEEIWDAQPEDAPRATEGQPGRSVFETQAILGVAKALRRRDTGATPTASVIDRVAWSLDLDYPNDDELRALMADSAGRADDLAGTAILIGLLRRCAAELEREFPAIGIPPQDLTGRWARELDEAVSLEIKRLVAARDYEAASSLSRLKNRFLDEPAVRRPSGRRTPSGPHRLARSGSGLRGRVRGPLVAAALVLTCLLSIWRFAGPGGTLTPVGTDTLARISPHLLRGGVHGNAFTGTLDPSWANLGEDEQAEEGSRLVASLRARGLNQVMVFDETRRLRIQALGHEPALVINEEGI